MGTYNLKSFFTDVYDIWTKILKITTSWYEATEQAWFHQCGSQHWGGREANSSHLFLSLPKKVNVGAASETTKWTPCNYWQANSATQCKYINSKRAIQTFQKHNWWEHHRLSYSSSYTTQKVLSSKFTNWSCYFSNIRTKFWINFYKWY